MSVSAYPRSNAAAMVAVGAGFAVWAVLSLAAGRMVDGRFMVREAWDTPAYFTVGLPVLLAGAGIAGWHRPERVWRWALLVVAGQAAAMALIHPAGSGLGLLPLAIVFVGLPLALVLTIAAIVGALISRRGWDGAILA
jgi:hypothetical protein